MLWSKDMETVQLAARVIGTRLVNSDQVFLLSADLENCLTVALSRLDTIPGGRITFHQESTRRLGSFDWDGRTLFLLNDSVRNDGFGDLYLYNSDTREIVQLNPIEGECCYRDARFGPDGKYVLFCLPAVRPQRHRAVLCPACRYAKRATVHAHRTSKQVLFHRPGKATACLATGGMISPASKRDFSFLIMELSFPHS